jgi:hypothetical protein
MLTLRKCSFFASASHCGFSGLHSILSLRALAAQRVEGALAQSEGVT